MSDDGRRIIEVGGLKMEIDERTARTVDQYRVGDRVKVLVKKYGDQYSIFPGVIVGFAAFRELPSIEVMYVSTETFDSEPLKFVTLNEKTENVDIAPMNDLEVMLDKEDVLRRIDQELRKRENALSTLLGMRNYFVEKFSVLFTDEVEVEPEPLATPLSE